MKFYDLFDDTIAIPSLEHLSPPPEYYTPNPKDPKGNWIPYEGYITPTKNRIWVPPSLDRSSKRNFHANK